ncbi:MAG: PadR family transcriptional regulator [Cyanobacteria bacterium J06636_16]
MALAHTILTFLSEQPSSGYDISKCLEEKVCCWKASPQQIYREINKMEAQQLLACELLPQVGRPNKKVCIITEAGRQELRRWHLEPTDPVPIREDLLVKVLGGAYLPNATLIQEICRRREVHLEQLQRYKSMELDYSRERPLSIQAQYRYLILRQGLRYEQSWIIWCDEVLVFLKQRLPKEIDEAT